jgi:glycerophosphoryl diester phosphodiesterase
MAKHRTLIVSHRGDKANIPESTIPAFKSAIAKGADAIEFDVHLTKDNKLVIHHDTYLGRTENGTGYISKFTLAELRKFDIGSWYDTKFKGLRMPSLDDVLSLADKTVRFEIELRTPSQQCLQIAVKKIADLGLVEQIELTSPHVPLICRATQLYPEIRTGIFLGPFPEWMRGPERNEMILGWLELSGARVAHLPLSVIDDDLIKQAHKRNLIIHGADLNSEHDIRLGLSLGIDQFSTDNLDFAIDARDCH